MTDKQGKTSFVEVVRSKSLDAALDLLREIATKNNKRKRYQNPEDKADKVASFCSSHKEHSPAYREKTNVAVGFSENYAVTEMRSCLTRHNWDGLCHLFPLVLSCYSKFEPVVWRYIFIILLCTPERDVSDFRQFLRMCISVQSASDDDSIRRLLAVRCADI